MSPRLALLAALLSLVGATPPALPVPERGRLVRLDRAALEVTHGAVARSADGRLQVDVAKMRAVSRVKGPPVAELRFTYLGPTAEQAPLASGELRRQVGLKLRAQDGCNVVYVMWRLAPKPGLVVSVKRNPGKRSVRDECGTLGYRNVPPSKTSPVPVVREGATHVLRAEMNGEQLRVQVDGRSVWEGDLGA
ncbi:MAG: hypothetical protein L0Y66_15735 [Myxococcaceae bacterium]|nr:hypothetical protein [Myxococcaceae bacterium]